MKKYRLKQWYPSLPKNNKNKEPLKEGSIVEIYKDDSNYFYFQFFDCCLNKLGFHYLSEEEISSDFWELIEEKYCDCNIPIFTLNSTFCMKCLKDIEEKKPLFTTADRVEIFEGDEYIAINYDFSKVDMVARDQAYSGDVMRFKYESNADEYIWKNKRLFSYNDIEKYQSGGEGVWYDIKAIAKRRSKE